MFLSPKLKGVFHLLMFAYSLIMLIFRVLGYNEWNSHADL